jgi:hypothetical protein
MAGGALMLLAPWIVAGLYLYFSRWPVRWWNTASDTAMLVAAVGFGLAGLSMLPLRRWQKALAALAYIPAIGALLVVFSLYFVCAAFSDCL